MTILWSYQAQQQQDQTADYIYKEFGKQTVLNFYRAIDEVEKRLLEFPKIGKEEPLLLNKSRAYRSIVVNKLSKVIYTIEHDHIRIHALWDTRREPKNQADALS